MILVEVIYQISIRLIINFRLIDMIKMLNIVSYPIYIIGNCNACN